jgi:ribosomal protein S18 acetylase RimI-like enzyme
VDDGIEQPSALTARPGVPADADRLARIMFRDPGREAVAIAGSARAAERFSGLLFRNAFARGTSSFVVAEADAQPIGFAELTHGSDMPSFKVVVSAGIRAMGIVGAFRAAARARARLRVDLAAPEGGVHLVELQVSPEHRNHGVGAFLLGRVDEYANQEHAAHISLTTGSDNPARRLYERHGYVMVGEKTDARYERITGSPGRILMVKAMGGTA